MAGSLKCSSWHLHEPVADPLPLHTQTNHCPPFHGHNLLNYEYRLDFGAPSLSLRQGSLDLMQFMALLTFRHTPHFIMGGVHGVGSPFPGRLRSKGKLLPALAHECSAPWQHWGSPAHLAPCQPQCLFAWFTPCSLEVRYKSLITLEAHSGYFISFESPCCLKYINECVGRHSHPAQLVLGMGRRGGVTTP